MTSENTSQDAPAQNPDDIRRQRNPVYRVGFLLGLAYWRFADLLDYLPGFNDGTAKAYDRALLRNPPGEGQ